jgi:hypothetical protein
MVVLPACLPSAGGVRGTRVALVAAALPLSAAGDRLSLRKRAFWIMIHALALSLSLLL